ncbi:hypothetical protein BJ912DRAFT_1002463 [Pholiota molesta]|nr:hypothetical protein BJ912DRAFT_1002463 [Pholiota molesta]
MRRRVRGRVCRGRLRRIRSRLLLDSRRLAASGCLRLRAPAIPHTHLLRLHLRLLLRTRRCCRTRPRRRRGRRCAARRRRRRGRTRSSGAIPHLRLRHLHPLRRHSHRHIHHLLHLLLVAETRQVQHGQPNTRLQDIARARLLERQGQQLQQQQQAHSQA